MLNWGLWGGTGKGLCHNPSQAPKKPALPPRVPSELLTAVKQPSTQYNIKTIKKHQGLFLLFPTNPIAVYTVLRLLMMDSRSVQNM